MRTHSARHYRRLVQTIQAEATRFADQTDAELRTASATLRNQVRAGQSLADSLVTAYALVVAAAPRVLHQTPRPNQILAAVAMADGRISDLAAGEGKTLAATMPLFLHGLAGNGNFLITASDYLAARDFAALGDLYRFLGLSVACAVNRAGGVDKPTIYAADIVYTTNRALGFDYLLDNLASDAADRFLPPLRFAVLDEADALLLDDAQTPLVLTGLPRVQSNYYGTANRMVQMLDEGLDFSRSADHRRVWFTPTGILTMQKFFGVPDLLGDQWRPLYRHLVLALRAHYAFERDRDYLVMAGAVVLIDPTTGRELTGVQAQAGQHQAIEAKEHLPLTPELRTMAAVTYQNLYGQFHELAGMAGTAALGARELRQRYGLRVFRVPTAQPVQRKTNPDQLYVTVSAAIAAAAATVATAHAQHRPVVIQADSPAQAQTFAQQLLDASIPHVLIATQAAARAAVLLSAAGQPDAVTVVTGSAGRGTAIPLGPGVAELGGVLLIILAHQSSRRADVQLQQCVAQNGEPGETRVFASLSDRVMVAQAPKWVARYVATHADDQSPLPVRGRFKQALRRAQANATAAAQRDRFNTQQYGDVLQEQRTAVYAARNRILRLKSLDELAAATNRRVAAHYAATHDAGDMTGMLDFIYQYIDRDFAAATLDEQKVATPAATLQTLMSAQLDEQHAKLPDSTQWQAFLHMAVLKALDAAWIDQVDDLQALQAMGQTRRRAGHDAVVEYQQAARRSFARMRDSMALQVARNLYCSELVVAEDGTVDVQFP